MRIVSMRLASGEEIVAHVEEETENGINLNKVRQLQIMDMGNGQAGAAFVPLMLLADDSKPIFVPDTAIVAFTETLNYEYEKRYLEAVSGIQLASSLMG